MIPSHINNVRTPTMIDVNGKFVLMTIMMLALFVDTRCSQSQCIKHFVTCCKLLNFVHKAHCFMVQLVAKVDDVGNCRYMLLT